MDWLEGVLKTGGPTFALAALIIWLLVTKIISPLLETLRKLTAAVTTMAAKMEYGGNQDDK